MPVSTGNIWSVDGIFSLQGFPDGRALVRLVSQGPGMTARVRYVVFSGISGPGFRLSSNIGILEHGRAYLIPRNALSEFPKERVGTSLAGTPIIPADVRALLPFEATEEAQVAFYGLSQAAFERTESPSRDILSGIGFRDRARREKCRLHVLNVGQGDTILFETPIGETWLIDSFLTTEQSFCMFRGWLADINGSGKIDRLILSHFHHDHIAGALRIVRNICPKEVLVPASLIHPTGQASVLLDECARKGILRKVDDTVEFTGNHFSVKIYPSIRLDPGLTANDKDPNHHELVITASSDRSFLLLSGDAPCGQLERIPDRPNINSTAYLKVSHHCSYTGTSVQLLKQCGPVHAATSCARHNRYSHPHDPPKGQINAICAVNGGTHSFTFAKEPVVWELL